MANRTGTTAQRIRIGLTGLAFAFLLVLMGSVISRSGQDSDQLPQVENAATNAPKEPLAELGVAPGPEPVEPEPAENESSEPQ
ncbi:MAG TPA: hypothetical protein VMK31_00770 [Sphingomicrobium sp.]|nr:hypothetical protein [Sphingomicrobium sp.]